MKKLIIIICLGWLVTITSENFVIFKKSKTFYTNKASDTIVKENCIIIEDMCGTIHIFPLYKVYKMTIKEEKSE